ncbi:VOC family protein [Mycobacterium sp. URHB0044]|jgi:4a-hydroxytetrahydrobiopterin dehydratase|uniref:VOC family protein n=1 Tax=Mycobacterium sp. URHB0044 TaxID=1380386 RepID=UPI00048A9ACE|nr:VOC family protein [Mycobacterium sp. URHB0044]
MDESARVTRQQVSDSVSPLGWRLVLGAIHTEVLTPSLVAAAEAATLSVSAVGDDGQGHLTVDVRSDRAVLRLRSADVGAVTGRDVRLAREVSNALSANGMRATPGAGSLQALEIAIDALDIPAVRPFWKAITGYVDEPGPSDLSNGLIDPIGRGPAIWFQQMDEPRLQRSRIHLDVDVPHDVATPRIDAAIAAGGRLLYDEEAPAFWVLADPEGNEACICTWQGRD